MQPLLSSTVAVHPAYFPSASFQVLLNQIRSPPPFFPSIAETASRICYALSVVSTVLILTGHFLPHHATSTEALISQRKIAAKLLSQAHSHGGDVGTWYIINIHVNHQESYAAFSAGFLQSLFLHLQHNLYALPLPPSLTSVGNTPISPDPSTLPPFTISYSLLLTYPIFLFF